MSLLPSRDPAVTDAEPRVISVDSDDADDVLSALSAATARNLLAALHEEPAPPGELADRVDTSLQNAQYHLEKLETAGALVICAGDENDTSGLRSALRSLLSGVAVVGVASLFVQELFGQSLFASGVERGSAGTSEPGSSYLPTGNSSPDRMTEAAERVAADGGTVAQSGAEAAVSALPPGAAFFAGGLVVLLALFAFWYVDR